MGGKEKQKQARCGMSTEMEENRSRSGSEERVTVAMAAGPGALVATVCDDDGGGGGGVIVAAAMELRGTGHGLAFLDHLLEALEPQSGQLLLHPVHVALVLLAELHGAWLAGSRWKTMAQQGLLERRREDDLEEESPWPLSQVVVKVGGSTLVFGCPVYIHLVDGLLS